MKAILARFLCNFEFEPMMKTSDLKFEMGMIMYPKTLASVKLVRITDDSKI